MNILKKEKYINNEILVDQVLNHERPWVILLVVEMLDFMFTLYCLSNTQGELFKNSDIYTYR